MSSSKKFKRKESQLSFAKIHVPKMKSVFWKYFGFPADENDEIITKQKVVCTLCNAVLTNHYNTTNIRAHVQSTHKAVFAQLIAKHGITIPPRKAQKKSKSRLELTKCESSLSDDERPLMQPKIKYRSSSPLNEEDSMNILEEVPLTYEDTDRICKDEEFLDGASTNNSLEQTNNEIVLPSNDTAKHKSLGPLNITVDINPIQMPVECDVEEAIRKLIIKDLQNVSSIYSCGMQEFLMNFLSNQILPSLCKMESSIKQLHNEEFTKLKDKIKVHSHVKSYSLSFDIWSNVENKAFVSIYFNNVSEEFENQFCDNLYMTVELNDYTMFEQIFEEFNLENCSAAVINCNHKILNTFLSNNDIPIVYCYSYIVNTCISEVFRITEVSHVLDEVLDVIARYAPEICSEDVEIPTICTEFPLTKLNTLKFFCESVSWPDELEALISKARQILEALSPLEITLDTLREEDIPLSSLFLPFANKIIDKHFILTEYDESMLKDIKTTVISEFKICVCSNNHLTVTALLDPRFHKFISIKNMTSCFNIFEKKYTQINKQRGHLTKSNSVKEEIQKNSRKSHLKLFFDCLDTPSKNIKETVIESDLRHYREEAFASLEESPLVWWNRYGSMYGCLRYLAEAYNCILGFVNMSFKSPLKDQISFNRKRFMLTGKLVDQILFLNKIN